jgi:hypothetical protein
MTQNTKKPLHNISNGPGKWDLLVCLGEKGKIVQLTVVPNEPGLKPREIVIDVHVIGIEQEDGSCESWNIKGCSTKDSRVGHKAFTAYYSTKNRTGCITFV